MEANSGVDLCRVTVVAPRTRMDLALPTDAPLADLLPTLLRFAGENPDDPAFLRGGWILQRLGEQALDASHRLGNLGIRDGDVLYLRHRESDIPEFAFDDVAEAILTATRRRAAWEVGDTRTASFLVSGVFFALGALVALTSGPGWVLPTVVMFIASVVLLAGGWAMSRALGDGRTGAFLGAWGVAYSGVGGLLMLGGDSAVTQLGPAQLTVGFACTFVAAGIAAVAIAAWWNGFFGVAAAALIGILAALSVLLFSFDAASVAAVTIAVSLGATPFLPTLCARLARLPLPMLPSSSDDLRKQTDILPGPTVLQQALTADQMMGGLLGASAVLCVVGSMYLMGATGWPGAALTGVAALALLLRARHFRGRTQRLWLMCGGIACSILMVIQLSGGGGDGMATLLAAGLPCVIIAGALAAWSVSGPDKRPSPYWARITDIFEVLVLLAIVPLTLGVAGVYQAILDKFFI